MIEEDDEKEDFMLTQLTDLEKQYLKKAKQKSQDNRIKPQVCLGKEFKGDAFIPHPKVVLFKDFEKKKHYVRKVTITNVSYTFNSFKLLPLDDEIRNFFEIKYKLPGRMSAGTTVTLFVYFNPQLEEDIESHIKLLAETGEIKVPLRCYTKKVAISSKPSSPSHLNFGKVMLAENKRLRIVITNDGALSTRFKLTGHLFEKYVVKRRRKKKKKKKKKKTVKKEREREEEEESTKKKEEEEKEEEEGEGEEIEKKEEEEEKTEITSIHDAYKKFPKGQLFTVSKIIGTIENHSKVTIDITFYPQEISVIQTSFSIEFEDQETDTMQFKATGIGRPVCIHLPYNVIDLKSVYLKTLYRDTLLICNRGKTAMKCELKVPKCLRKHLTFIPKIGFVQPTKTEHDPLYIEGEEEELQLLLDTEDGKLASETSRNRKKRKAVVKVKRENPFKLQVKFRPLPGLREAFPKEFLSTEEVVSHGDPSGFRINVPIEIHIPNQSMPIFFNLQTHICTSDLLITPRRVGFGKCAVNESVMVPITIKNTSELAQQFGFVHPPPSIKVRPNDGFFSILPKEEISLEMLFTPLSQIDYNFSVKCKTDRAEEYTIQCLATGIRPPVTFSNNYIQFRSIALGDRVSQSILLINNTKTPRKFRFDVPYDPCESGISVVPASGLIPPKDKFSVFVTLQSPEKTSIQTFRRKIEVKEEDLKEGGRKNKRRSSRRKQAKRKRKSGRQSGGGGGGGEQEEDQEDENKKKKVYRYEKEEREVSNYQAWEGSGEGEIWSRHRQFVIPCYISEYSLKAIYLGVQATVMEAVMDVSVSKIDYGPVPLFHPKYVTFKVQNKGGTTLVDVDIPPLEYSVFSISKKPHVPIPPGESRDVTVTFTPFDTKKYKFIMKVISEANERVIELTGEGIQPQFTIKPDEKEVWMGEGVAPNEEVSKEFSLCNLGKIPIPYEISFSKTHPLNHDGSKPFFSTPREGKVLPKEEQVIQLRFKPDHSFSFFRTKCIVRYGGPEHRIDMELYARCWNPGLYILFVEEESLEDQIIKDKRELEEDAFESIFGGLSSSSSSHRSSRKRKSGLTGGGSKKKGVVLEEEEEDEEDSSFPSSSSSQTVFYNKVFCDVKVGETRTHTFEIGNTKSSSRGSGGSSSRGEFNIIPLLHKSKNKNNKSKSVTVVVPDSSSSGRSSKSKSAKSGISIDPMRGSVDSGGTKKITIKFSPKEEALSLIPVPEVDVWVESKYNIILKDSRGERIVTLFVRGQILNIN